MTTMYIVEQRPIRIPGPADHTIGLGPWTGVEGHGPMPRAEAERIREQHASAERGERHEEEMRHVDAGGVPMPILDWERYEGTQYRIRKVAPA